MGLCMRKCVWERECVCVWERECGGAREQREIKCVCKGERMKVCVRQRTKEMMMCV